MKKTDQNQIHFVFITTALLCLVVIFGLLFFSYIKRLDQTLTEENCSRLSEVSGHVASYIQELIEEQQTSLNIIASSISMIPNSVDRISYLNQMSLILGFEYIGFAGEDGLLYSKAFLNPQDISDEDYFKAALNGESYMTDYTRYIFSDRAVGGLIFSVPTLDGVVVAMINISKIGSEVQVNSFNGKGYSYVIDSNGDLMLHARSLQYQNYFRSLINMQFADGYSLEQMKDDILSDREGFVIYSELGTEKYAYYRPINFNGWTVVSTVPKGVITEKTTKLTSELVLICMAMVILFLTLLTTIGIQFLQLESKRKASRARSTFLANMSHDMRTPMNAIIGMTTIADAHIEEPDVVKDCLKKITFSSKHLLGLINDVLDMSRIENGKMSLAQNPIFLPDIIETTVNMVYGFMLDKHQHFSIQLHHIKHEYLYGDSLRIGQIFTNILSNAMKYTNEGGTISMEIEELPSKVPNFALFQFTFADNGIGMTPEFLKLLFMPFSRELDSKVNKIEGSGLGMSIAKKIVDMMNGTIMVNSEKGKGTSFLLTLSLPIDRSNPKFPTLPTLSVLIVEKETDQGMEAVDALQNFGIQADLASNKAEMIAYMKDRHLNSMDYHAVFLDRDIFESGALEDIHMLNFPLPFLILCAYSWQDIYRKTIEKGITYFAQKPLFPSTLCRCLLKTLESQKIEQPKETDTICFDGKHILLAEDNELNREIAVSLLEETGAVIICALNGQECVEQFLDSKEGWFDLILMDIQMPVMTGYEATRHIRQSHRFDATIPILAMSANAFTEDRKIATDVGMSGYLTKPIDIKVWMEELKKYLCEPNSNLIHTRNL